MDVILMLDEYNKDYIFRISDETKNSGLFVGNCLKSVRSLIRESSNNIESFKLKIMKLKYDSKLIRSKFELYKIIDVIK